MACVCLYQWFSTFLNSGHNYNFFKFGSSLAENCRATSAYLGDSQPGEATTPAKLNCPVWFMHSQIGKSWGKGSRQEHLETEACQAVLPVLHASASRRCHLGSDEEELWQDQTLPACLVRQMQEEAPFPLRLCIRCTGQFHLASVMVVPALQHSLKEFTTPWGAVATQFRTIGLYSIG